MNEVLSFNTTVPASMYREKDGTCIMLIDWNATPISKRYEFGYNDVGFNIHGLRNVVCLQGVNASGTSE